MKAMRGFSVWQATTGWPILAWLGLGSTLLRADIDLTWVGGCHTSGQAWGVVVQGNHAYMAAGSLEVIDVGNPASPQRVGAYAPSGNASGVALLDNCAYIVAGALEVIDVGNPAKPRRVGRNYSFTPECVTTAGEKVFVAAGADGLVILKRYPPPPQFSSLRLDPDGFHLTVRGEAGQAVHLQRSVDLNTWEDWMNVTASGNPQALLDSSAAARSSQLYRALVP